MYAENANRSIHSSCFTSHVTEPLLAARPHTSALPPRTEAFEQHPRQSVPSAHLYVPIGRPLYHFAISVSWGVGAVHSYLARARGGAAWQLRRESV